jgi:hypothetical protein
VVLSRWGIVAARCREREQQDHAGRIAGISIIGAAAGSTRVNLQDIDDARVKTVCPGSLVGKRSGET